MWLYRCSRRLSRRSLVCGKSRLSSSDHSARYPGPEGWELTISIRFLVTARTNDVTNVAVSTRWSMLAHLTTHTTLITAIRSQRQWQTT